jgi:methionine sulfoxide reductase catalytic subunit
MHAELWRDKSRMLIKKPADIRESEVTPKELFLKRREFIAAAGVTAAAVATNGFGALGQDAGEAAQNPNAPKLAARKNAALSTDEKLNSYKDVTTYNNFYEFGSHKEIHGAAEALDTDPWTIAIDGMVEKPFAIGVEDLVARMPVEERIVRHRCVEAWSMVVPWIGFPLSALVALAKPLGSAKFVEFQTFQNPEVARGQRQFWYPWPYIEGLTMEEAGNELSFMVVGAYGKVLHKSFGAPIRLHLPWKYGFKSIKSIVRISFTDQRPVSFWEDLQASEYGFWANVNPEVAHPRWSQATERVLGTDERVPTQLFNGYGEAVAHLYTAVEEGDRLWR